MFVSLRRLVAAEKLVAELAGRLAKREEQNTLQTLVATQGQRIVDLERELATERARFEWLTIVVTEMKTERAILLERVLEVQIPVMTIARDVAASPAPARPSQAELREQTAFAPAPGKIYRPDEASKDIATQVAEAMAAGDLFNDVGDARAKQIGVGWDDEGRMVSDVPMAVAGAR